MSTGICHLSTIPMRAEPSSKSELVSQLLMGETYSLIEERPDWVCIKTDWDAYEGWINRTQVFLPEHVHATRLITSSPVSYAIDKGNRILSMGSELAIGTEGYLLRHEDHPVEISAQNADIDPIYLAKSFLGTPYLWGGRTFMGIDCSGLVQVVAKAKHKAIFRDAKDQAQLGETVGFIEQVQPGDLAFFENEEGKIVHVGMLLSPTQIIHAHGWVRIDAFDSRGIFREDAGKYTHQLSLIKRIW
ncbi:MAG: C40 family peptidase [Bacteroidia bacterium]